MADENVVEGVDADLTPKIGMEFDSEEHAYDFYKAYGGKKGFSIRRHRVNRHRTTKIITNRVFVCAKEGTREIDKRARVIKNPRQETRTMCEARFSINLDVTSEKYKCYEFKDEHNHPLVTGEMSHMLRSQRKILESQAAQLEMAEAAGIPLGYSYELMGIEAGGRDAHSFLKVDQKNYLRSKRQNPMDLGEMGRILNYFETRVSHNSMFFHAIQLDIEEKIANIFWADAEMRIDYEVFGDVVCFDTTYKINSEHRPVAVFVGLNHHRETVVFGAALMYDETAESFTWLFETFLKAMENKYPKTIFTDQDPVMARAIEDVMPNTSHRLCLWHLSMNAMKHIPCIFEDEQRVHSLMGELFYEVEDELDFEVIWDDMLKHWNVQDNSWLKKTYKVKEKWAFAYVRGEWSAGMRSTQLSESFNAKLKGYLKPDHNLSQFFMHFERLLKDKRYKEVEAEYSLIQRLPRVTLPVKWVTTAGMTYTKKIFEEFQVEFIHSIEMFVDKTDEGYIVQDSGRRRVVTGDHQDNVKCSCKLFERKGILCSHAIKVLRDVMRVMDLPQQYVLKRWTRKAREQTNFYKDVNLVEEDGRLQKVAWNRSLCSKFTRIASRASDFEGVYRLADFKLDELNHLVEEMISLRLSNPLQSDKTDASSLKTYVASESASGGGVGSEALVQQPKRLKKKEDPYHRGKRRTKGELEKSLAKGKNKEKANGDEIQLKKKKVYKKIQVPKEVYKPSLPPPTQALDLPPPCLPPPSRWHLSQASPSTITQSNMYASLFYQKYPHLWKESQNVTFQTLLQQTDNLLGFPFHESQASNTPRGDESHRK